MAGDNVPEYTVSELSFALKRTLEDSFGFVRVRGEISGFKRAASGHLYFSLKDSDAVLDGVCWRGTAGRLDCQPEDGLEVICTGRITTYAGRSKYQIVIDSMAPAGVGALMALLEERRKKLAAEGLFAAEHKRPLPYLPDVIGVVTSPTGAVIRDILHRIADRFPRRVVLWPVLVQGEQAAEQVARAVAGFNAAVADGPVPRPDVLIVARGGGSLEDLWAFNEEVVVRAAAASTIPLVSAVGHETDTTLVDLAADVRAPTPTAAAELVVPVRAELAADVAQLGDRLFRSTERMLAHLSQTLAGLARGLPDPVLVLGSAAQRLDDAAERLPNAVAALLDRAALRLSGLAGRIGSPEAQLSNTAARLGRAVERLDARYASLLDQRGAQLGRVAARLTLAELRTRLPRLVRDVADMGGRLQASAGRALDRSADRLSALARVLEGLSYRAVLERGYAVVRDQSGRALIDAAAVKAAGVFEIELRDGRIGATTRPEPGAAPRRRRKADDTGSQGRLL